MTEKTPYWFANANRLAQIFDSVRDEVVASGAETPAAVSQATVDELVRGGVIQSKAWWQSVGINGSAVTLIGAVVSLAAGIAGTQGIMIDVGAATEVVIGLIGLIGGAMSWWGRVRATQPISRSQVLPGLNIGGRP